LSSYRRLPLRSLPQTPRRGQPIDAAASMRPFLQTVVAAGLRGWGAGTWT
jgi:hypothetical protein